jgi:Ca2+-binding RTX toxin-like protein
VLGALVALCLAAPAAGAATRHAAPAGLGTACTQMTPCSIETAINGAGTGDEVIVAPGDYGSQPAPLTTLLANNNAISVHGTDGEPRPRIFTEATIGLQLTDPGSSVRWLEIRYQRMAMVNTACSLAGTVEQIVVQAAPFGTACSLRPEGGTVRNSVFSSQSADGLFLLGTWTIRGVSSAGGINGLDVQGTTSGATSATVTNSILRGGTADVRAIAGVGETASATLSYSNYATTQLAGGDGSESITPAGSPTNQTAAPLFLDAANGDLRQAPGSPTIDAGIDDPANGTQDFEGEARTLNGRTDIGADERPFPAEPPAPPAPGSCRGRQATHTGTEGHDLITGTPRPDVIAALGGNDVVRGLGGADVVCGAHGKDRLNGGSGPDTLLGDQGADILRGRGGKDKLRGGAGRDALLGGSSRDLLAGGGGRDRERQ